VLILLPVGGGIQPTWARRAHRDRAAGHHLAGLRVRVMVALLALAAWGPGSAGASCTTTSASACSCFSTAGRSTRAGYHIIQSQIAIGSAVCSARLDERQQAQLEFLPSAPPTSSSRHREEFGLLGLLLLLLLYVFVVGRAIYLATRPDTFAPAAGSLALTSSLRVHQRGMSRTAAGGRRAAAAGELWSSSVVTLLAGFVFSCAVFTAQLMGRSRHVR